MASNNEDFQLLKTFSGIIHRQPLFVNDDLTVDSYHFSFLDMQGKKLDDDSELPAFIEQIPTILPAISEQHKALLSVPESWREQLLSANSNIDFTFDLNGASSSNGSVGSFARNASLEKKDDDSNTLLINLADFDANQLVEHLPYWRDQHSILCATNVNASEQFKFCQQHDLDLLQGQFYTSPAEKKHTKLAPSTHIVMELLVKLYDPDVDAEELNKTISLDIVLSYKLLRLINSAFFALPNKIDNIKQAIVLLGAKKIKTWASLLSLSGLDDKPNELRIVAMARAKMCELLSKYYKGDPELFFAAGFFSSLDALMDKPLPSLLNNLPLSDELNQALTRHGGAAGRALHDVLAYEKGDWKAIDASPLPAEVISRTYLDAIHWAKELNTQLKD